MLSDSPARLQALRLRPIALAGDQRFLEAEPLATRAAPHCVVRDVDGVRRQVGGRGPATGSYFAASRVASASAAFSSSGRRCPPSLPGASPCPYRDRRPSRTALAAETPNQAAAVKRSSPHRAPRLPEHAGSETGVAPSPQASSAQRQRSITVWPLREKHERCNVRLTDFVAVCEVYGMQQGPGRRILPGPSSISLVAPDSRRVPDPTKRQGGVWGGNTFPSPTFRLPQPRPPDLPPPGNSGRCRYSSSG